MKTQELRIGNTIAVKGIKNPLTIREIMTHGDNEYFIVFDTFHTSIKSCNPVPITDQWLKNSGLENNYPGSNEWVKGSICFEKNNTEFYYSAGEGVKLSINIQYVHQLQNIYFALTGEELL